MSESPGQRFTLDVNVAVKWYVSEPGVATGNARLLLQRWRDGTVGLTAPSYIYHEFANVLTRLSKAGHISASDTVKAVQQFISYQIPVVSADQLCVAAAELTLSASIDYYDALYAAVSKYYGFPLITDDWGLHNTMRSKGLRVIHLKNYR